MIKLLRNEKDSSIVRSLFCFMQKFTYKAKTLGGMRTRLIGRTLGAASLQADSLFQIITP
jgi:hypothetical protein